jgi:5-epi-alpha-selinene synthase
MTAAVQTPAHHAASASHTGLVLAFEPTTGRRGRPRLECDLAPALNLGVDGAHAHTLAWAVEMGLIDRDGPKFERFRAARFAWLAARAYPSVSREQLDLTSDWITFLFFYDDMCDTQKATNPSYLDRLVSAENRLIELGHGAPVCDDDTPLDRSLADIRARAGGFGDVAWLDRLGGHIEEYIEGCRWERLIRLQGQVPSLATYSKLRPLVSAVFPSFDLAGMCIDGARTSFAENILVQQLEVMANNYICWVNDIYGIDKEIGEQTTSNVVIVLAHQDGLSWDHALDRAIELCNTELQAFLALEQQIAELVSTDCRGYIDALKTWMRGNLDWYAETERYGIDDEGEALSACWSTWAGWDASAAVA